MVIELKTSWQSSMVPLDTALLCSVHCPELCTGASVFTSVFLVLPRWQNYALYGLFTLSKHTVLHCKIMFYIHKIIIL